MTESKEQVYEYVVVLHPAPKGRKAGERARIIVGPAMTVAKDEQEAMLVAGRAVPDEHASATDRVEVRIRPF